jgi:fructan beta-fructosidase
MSNWDYANTVPTTVWRNAMTVPRILFMEDVGPKIYVGSRPVQELYSLARHKVELRHLVVDSTASLTGLLKDTAGRWVLEVRGSADQDFDLVFSDAAGEKVTFGYNTGKQQFWLDRSASGRVDFHPGFGGTYTAPRLSGAEDIDLEFVMDHSSLEVFADGGLTVMTATFFPQQPMTRVRVNTTGHWVIKRLSYMGLASIW